MGKFIEYRLCEWCKRPYPAMYYDQLYCKTSHRANGAKLRRVLRGMPERYSEDDLLNKRALSRSKPLLPHQIAWLSQINKEVTMGKILTEQEAIEKSIEVWERIVEDEIATKGEYSRMYGDTDDMVNRCPLCEYFTQQTGRVPFGSLAVPCTQVCPYAKKFKYACCDNESPYSAWGEGGELEDAEEFLKQLESLLPEEISGVDDITLEVDARPLRINDSMLIELLYCGERIGLFDGFGFHPMKQSNYRYAIDPYAHEESSCFRFRILRLDKPIDTNGWNNQSGEEPKLVKLNTGGATKLRIFTSCSTPYFEAEIDGSTEYYFYGDEPVVSWIAFRDGGKAMDICTYREVKIGRGFGNSITFAL